MSAWKFKKWGLVYFVFICEGRIFMWFIHVWVLIICVLHIYNFGSIVSSENFEIRISPQSLTMYCLNMFVASVVVSVCLKLNLQVIWDLKTANNWRHVLLVLQQQSTGNSSKFSGIICRSTAGRRSHIKMQGGNVSRRYSYFNFSTIGLARDILGPKSHTRSYN